mmetsp:Transcript_90173/g.232777  ORF Transcript_90173/g.232777 Transcript_90173/m.232777 type:complete len:169 (-) Transcript_90173:63-569(-)
MGQSICCAGQDILPETEWRGSHGTAPLEDLAFVEKVSGDSMVNRFVTSSDAKQTFAVTLRKSSDRTSLGVDVDVSNGKELIIDKVQEHGLVADWNKLKPESQLRVNDVVVAVNGVKGNAELMTTEVANNQVLEFVVCRTTPKRMDTAVCHSWCDTNCVRGTFGKKLVS